MKTACVCWTPYQIFNIVNFIEQNMEQIKGTCDLYIIDMKALQGIKNKLEREQIFENIYIVKNYKEKYYILDRFEKMIDIVFPKRALKSKLLVKQKIKFDNYSKIISSGWNKYFISLVAVNPNAKVILLEDGTGSYLGDFRDKEMPLTYKLLNKITNKGALSVNVAIEYLYEKELMSGVTTYPISTMPKVNNEVFENLSRVFSYVPTSYYKNKKYIFLTQPLNDIQKLSAQYQENLIFDVLKQYSEKVLVRVHPRQNKINTFLDIDEKKEVWELLCKNEINNDKVLIGIFSSSQITPKIIYNKEPKLIFLNEIALENGFGIHKEFYTFLNKLKKIYHNDIYLPRNIAELKNILEKIDNEDMVDINSPKEN